MILNISFPSGFTKQSAARNKEILAVNRGKLYLISPLPPVIGMSLKDVHLLSNSTAVGRGHRRIKVSWLLCFFCLHCLVCQRSSAPTILSSCTPRLEPLPCLSICLRFMSMNFRPILTVWLRSDNQCAPCFEFCWSNCSPLTSPAGLRWWHQHGRSKVELCRCNHCEM